MPRIDSENATRFWFDQRTPGLSLLSADFTTHEYPTHIHEALLVAVTEVGGSEIKAGGVSDEAHAGALLVVNPTEPHSSRMKGSRRWTYRSFYLDPVALNMLAGAYADPVDRFALAFKGDSDSAAVAFAQSDP